MNVNVGKDTNYHCETVTRVSFRSALDVISQFAESELSGTYFSYFDVSKLENAARLIRQKLEQSED